MYQTTGAMDLNQQLQFTMQTIEMACNSIQMHLNPAAAEATMLSLCQSPRPYQTCQFILENSQVAHARFVAAAAVGAAAIREWGFLSANEKRILIRFCLCYIIKHASSPHGYVQAKVSSVAAQLMKRGWLEFTVAEKEEFFYEVKQAVIGSHGLDAQGIGINFLESLVSEFSPSTSSVMGLPREFHEQCRKSLELDYLKTFYSWAQDAALSVTPRIIDVDSASHEAKICSSAIRFMLQILNWEFRYNTNKVGARNCVDVFQSATKQDNGSLRGYEYILVQPGPSWRDILISSGHIGWLLGLYSALREKFSSKAYWIDCAIAASVRKIIVQFCSLTGTVFPSDNGHTQGQHLLQLLSVIVQWVDPPADIATAINDGRSESEMLDGCRALLSISAVTTPVLFDQLLKHIRPYGTLNLLSALTCEVVKDLLAHPSEDEPWSWVARDILLDTWTILLTETDNSGLYSLFPLEGIGAAANLFALIVETELKAASASSHENEDYVQASTTAMDERLSSYALIARAAIETTIPLLTGLFSERLARLYQVRGTGDPTETLEELYSLLLITGHVLADEGEGETPLVPKAIQTHFLDFVETEKHPVVVLSSSIIKFAEMVLDPEIRAAFFSPRLMEAVIWFLARWSCTYLMPPEESEAENSSFQNRHEDGVQVFSQHSRKALFSFCGEKTQGKALLDIIVRVSVTTLIQYPGEKDLQALTCNQLLRGVVRRKNVCAHLVTLDSWRDLSHCFANEKVLFSLNAAEQRSLSQSLVLSATGIKSSEASNQYVRDLMGHLTSYLVEISGKSDLKSVAFQPDIILAVTCLLERLRGASSAAEPRIQRAVYEMGLAVMNPILIFLEVYKNESAVIYLLLKFVVDWVDGQISYLEAQETAIVVSFCVRLLQLYSSHNIGKISLSISSNLQTEANTEKYKDLRALLQLLSKLCSKDMVDFSSEGSDTIEGQEINISQVVFMGLHIVSPLITLDLLKYPKLCIDYFELLSYMLEVYPEMVAQLNRDAFANILGNLDFGLNHQDVDVVYKCLRALKALASYHHKETGAGKVGLGQHATCFTYPNGKLQDGILSRFLRSLLKFLLFEDYRSELISSAADALLPLILCDHNFYQRLCDELIEGQADPMFRSRLANALHSLTSTNNVSSTLNRPNFQRFQKNLHTFLIEVRGFLRTI